MEGEGEPDQLPLIYRMVRYITQAEFEGLCFYLVDVEDCSHAYLAFKAGSVAVYSHLRVVEGASSYQGRVLVSEYGCGELRAVVWPPSGWGNWLNVVRRDVGREEQVM